MKKILGLDLGTNSIGWAIFYKNLNCDRLPQFMRQPKESNSQQPADLSNKFFITQIDWFLKRKIGQNIFGKYSEIDWCLSIFFRQKSPYLNFSNQRYNINIKSAGLEHFFQDKSYLCYAF